MYSVVLMMALTSGGDTPALGGRGGCYGGCYGSYGGCYGGCYGGGYGCHGGRGHGCHGGRGHGCRGGRGHGCHGGRKHGGCCGCYGGGYGGCYGGGFGGCYGSFAGGFGGCYGGVGGMGGVGGVVVPPVAPVAPTAPAAPANSKNKVSIEGAAPATLIVSVPADARLSIDGEETTSTTTQRTFVSPALEIGRTYHYTLQAEIIKNGAKVTMSKEIAVQAGEETRVSFNANDTGEIASR